MRTVVFIDYQNMYKGAREAFGWTASPGHFGNFRPISLGRVMTRDADRELEQVRVYTGVPTPRRDGKGNAIQQRRIAQWVADSPDKVEVFPRPLSYPPLPGGREKGVDVELAIDIVAGALDDVYDVAVLASADTDLVPALQLVRRRCPDKTIVTMTWEPLPECVADTAEPIDIPGGGAVRCKIPKRDFDRIADKRNYVTSASEPKDVVGESRWGKIKNRLGP